MHDAISFGLRLAQGPVFRCAFALAVLGLLRLAVLGLSDVVAAYVTDSDRGAFRRKIRQHALWWFFPSRVLSQTGAFRSRALYAYHVGLFGTAVLFHTLVVLLPIFMVAHVYLWERGLGIAWPSFPGDVADVLALLTIVSGVALFLGRVYSPVLRALEPAWTFFKPLLLLVPFLTGVLARHPTWSPLDYQVILLIHVLSAATVLALLPFGRLLSSIHTRIGTLIPSAAWRSGPGSTVVAPVAVTEEAPAT
jgi:hypothetical protein